MLIVLLGHWTVSRPSALDVNTTNYGDSVSEMRLTAPHACWVMLCSPLQISTQWKNIRLVGETLLSAAKNDESKILKCCHKSSKKTVKTLAITSKLTKHWNILVKISVSYFKISLKVKKISAKVWLRCVDVKRNAKTCEEVQQVCASTASRGTCSKTRSTSQLVFSFARFEPTHS